MKKRVLPMIGLLLSFLLAVSCGKSASSSSLDRDAVSDALEQAGYTVAVSDFIIIGEISYDADHLYAVKDGDFLEVLWSSTLSESSAANYFTARFDSYDVLAQADGAYLCGTGDAVAASGIIVTNSLVANADLT